MDKQLDRNFLKQRSPYVAVKYHVRYDFPRDLIALHNFQDGYCGSSAIEEGKYCLCYLTSRANLRRFGTVEAMEREILYKNPHLRRIFETAEFLYDKPEVINEISFAPKKAIENHILMAGDAAGLITPLCGNGMSMAIQAGSILSQLIVRYHQQEISREELEQLYQKQWRGQFASRLWIGRQIQRLFGDEWLSEMSVQLFQRAKPLARFLITQTHGEVF